MKKINNVESVKHALKAWIEGRSYSEILTIFSEYKIYKKWGNGSHKIIIDDVIDYCDNLFSFDGCLIVNSLYEFAYLNVEKDNELILLLIKLQRHIKYGLPDDIAIAIYEIGFCDRVIAQDIKNSLGITANNRLGIIQELRIKNIEAKKLLQKYPAYYIIDQN